MRGFKELFNNDNAVLDWLRNTGFSFVDRSSVLKGLFIKSAEVFSD